MKFFRNIYDKTLELSTHPYAMFFLCLIAFAESSFFPIPPDIFLIPLILAQKERAWLCASLCTLFSVLGGIAGYGIGYFLFETIGVKVVEFYNYQQAFENFKELYNQHGVLIVAAGAFTPIPYKIVTIASGVTQLNLTLFILASLLSRGARYFILAAILWKFGTPVKKIIDKYFNLLTIIFFILLVSGFIIIS